MNRIVVRTRVGTDGNLHLDLPVGEADANSEVQVTIDPLSHSSRPARAVDLLNSGLVGLWADRTDIGDSQTFARGLREEAQTRRRDR